jgi:hypothetical protein
VAEGHSMRGVIGADATNTSVVITVSAVTAPV